MRSLYGALLTSVSRTCRQFERNRFVINVCTPLAFKLMNSKPLVLSIHSAAEESIIHEDNYAKLFADDAKLYTVITDESSAANLQSSLDYVLRRSDHWQLKLSPIQNAQC